MQIDWPNLLFHNPGQPSGGGVYWPDVAAGAGLSQSWRQYTAAVADFDDDGRLDLLQMFPTATATQAPSLLQRSTESSASIPANTKIC